MALTKSLCLKYYKRREIQEALLFQAKNREVGLRYTDSFGKRPDILSYPRDVLELALAGVTSFHGSEELWENPLSLNSSLSRLELNDLRLGWDLVLDVDCKILEYSRIATDLIIQFLQHCGVKEISVKFSGNKGFHIGVPFESFPQKVGRSLTKDLFPEAPRKMALYIRENIKEELGRRILEWEQNNFSAVKEKVGLEKEDIIRFSKNQFGDQIPQLKVDKFLEIDTILLSPRHLYRLPYSLHEKSGLVSLPCDPQKILMFEKETARPETVKVSPFIFVDRQVNRESARHLLMQALDFEVKREEKLSEPLKSHPETVLTSPLREEFFPPCMKLMLNGLADGKKRGIFCLSNFLGKIGWSKPEIEALLAEWNKEKNPEPLRPVYLRGQLLHFKPGERLPPNCSHEAYYLNIGVCKPDERCAKVKNPVNYTLLKWKRRLAQKEEESQKRAPGKENQKTTKD